MTEHTTTSAGSHVETKDKSAKLAPPVTMGMIVCYHHRATVRNPAEESPAIVLAVRDDDTVRLMVFAQGGPELVEGVTQGEADDQWEPLVVPGQAAKKPKPRLTPDQVALT